MDRLALFVVLIVTIFFIPVLSVIHGFLSDGSANIPKLKRVVTRTIIAFFVIDPNHRIISTRDINPQQTIFSPEEANLYRDRLMYHRKYFVSSLNKKVLRDLSRCVNIRRPITTFVVILIVIVL